MIACLAVWLSMAMSAGISDAHAEVVVIVSAKSHVNSLSAEQTARIFLGKVSNFPDGEEAVPIDQPQGRTVRDEFYKKIVHKSASQVAAYWAKVIFTGDGRPPVMLENNAAVRRAVAANPNAIGYIEKTSVNKSVKVILEP